MRCLWDNLIVMNQKIPSITEYDRKNYDYSRYWEGQEREYEHKAEVVALERMLERIENKSQKTFVDLGGGYGRLMPVYAPKFKHSILLDYSIKNLQKGVELAEHNGLNLENTTFVAANLYKMPFKDMAIDAGELIRVIHHIKDLPLLMDELARIIRSDLLIDCPNKRHFLAVARSLLKGTGALKQTLSLAPYQQPHQKDSKDFCGGSQIFLNYHPKHLSKVASEKGFEENATLSISNFRHPQLKKLIPLKLLLSLEKLVQKTGAPLLFGPNIWLLLSRKDKEVETKPRFETTGTTDPFELFSCPKCHGDLSRTTTGATCSDCNAQWSLIDGKIWDFRHN